MVKDYIVNAGMLVAFLSITYQIFRDTGLNYKMKVKFKILSGIIFGLLGVILMVYSINLPNNLIIDFRNFAVFLSALTGGWISAILSSIIISFFRILINGINQSSIIAITVIGILTAVFCIITSFNIKRHLKWLIAIGISELVTCAAFIILIKESKLLNQVIMSYCISLTLISFLVYYYIAYIESLEESFRHYKREANRDFLTGLNNVRQFDKLYNSIIESVKENNGIVSLLYIDIDFFKKVNDTYGHKEGDIVLRKLSEILKKSCRNNDVVSRNGGEEFTVVLRDCPLVNAVEIAEHIRKNVSNTPIELSNGVKINITISIGVTSYPEIISDIELLRQNADEALYEAKRTGRNKVVFSR